MSKTRRSLRDGLVFTVLLISVIAVLGACTEDGSEPAPQTSSDDGNPEEAPAVSASSWSETTRQLITLFAELQSFKDESEFHFFGFAVGGPYNDWLSRLEMLREEENGVETLGDIGYVVFDLYTLAMDYANNEGEPADEFSLEMEAAFVVALKRLEAE